MRWRVRITVILIFKVSRINLGLEVRDFVQMAIAGGGEEDDI